MIQSIIFFKNPKDIMPYFYEGVTTDEKNTYYDWHIIATSRPVFEPPKVKTTYIDVPGGNGSLDLTESLTKFPLYENREGTFKFRVLNEWLEDGRMIYASNDKQKWADRYSEIMEYLHGKSLCAVLNDDPNWFYQGRFTVDEWESGDTWSEITIGYNVNPHKWYIRSSTEPWLWDPFNFEKDVIWDFTVKDIVINNPNDYTEITMPAYIKSAADIKGFFGGVPISPTIIFEPVNNSDNLEVKFVNDYLDINLTQTFKKGTTFVPDFLIYGQTEPYKFYLKGNGKVSIDFRVGRL